MCQHFANFLTHHSVCGPDACFAVGKVCAPSLCLSRQLREAYEVDFADVETDAQREGKDSLKAT